jgi:phospholipase/carboxylesterase
MKGAIFFVLFLIGFATVSCSQNAGVQDGLVLKYLVKLPAKTTVKPPLIILLHGYGSNEKDLFELKNYLPEEYIVVAARATYLLGGDSYQWFSKEMVNGKYSGNAEKLTNSRNTLVKFIDQLTNKYHADKGRVYVMGFSQGAMMSYEMGLVNPQKVKGIGILSGVMPESLKPLISKDKSLAKLKIFVAHGTGDKVLLYEDGLKAVNYLKTLGLQPEFHTYKDMGHTITNDVMTDLIRWIQG